MAKRLLTKDFENIVTETFSMPESDFHNYYLNVVEEHHAQNPNITTELIQILNGWIVWHNSKVYSGKLITIKREDGTTETIDAKQTFEVDENGNRTKVDLGKTGVSLFPKYDISVNRAFFENQIKILEAIQSGIDLKHKIEAIENQLPTVIKDTLAEYPSPTGFDLDELQSRVKLLSCIPYIVENLKTQVEELTKRQTDTPHQITNPVAERIFSTDQYKAFLNQIQQNGFYNVTINNQQVKVYTPELMVLFTSNDLTLQNAHTDEKTTINGRDYLETYAKRFNEGLQYFESNFTANVNTLYGANAEKYVNDIHFNYWNKQHERNVKGWHYFKTSYPLLISHKEIGKYGFYAGIISKVEELASKHPKLFETFENNEPKTNQPEPQETAKEKPEQVETLANIITHTKSTEIVELIKIQYKNIKGKQLKLLLLALQQTNLLPKEGIANKFHRCCKKEFNWNIASYNAMNGYKYNSLTDKEILDTMQGYLKQLIEKLETK
jgi:hypothetical protein